MKLGYAYHDSFLLHDTGSFHPESPKRLEAILNKLSRTAYFPRLEAVSPEKLSLELLQPAHNAEHARRFQSIEGRRGNFDGDTPFSESSFDAARLAAGSGISLAKKILNGELDSGIALVRPPGHHAETGKAMGFCLLNNIAITAHYLLSQGAERIYILDWDVHHGNGTQEIFYGSDRVFFTSLHQYPFYPGTGSSSETGSGKGKGYTLNIPMQMGSGDSEYLEVFRNRISGSISEFAPDYILISAGFDAHKKDPLANMNLSTGAFAEFTRIVSDTAKGIDAKLLSFLEGGYDLEALAESVEAHISVLAG